MPPAVLEHQRSPPHLVVKHAVCVVHIAVLHIAEWAVVDVILFVKRAV
jgi:hypothetical protein